MGRDVGPVHARHRGGIIGSGLAVAGGTILSGGLQGRGQRNHVADATGYPIRVPGMNLVGRIATAGMFGSMADLAPHGVDGRGMTGQAILVPTGN